MRSNGASISWGHWGRVTTILKSRWSRTGGYSIQSTAAALGITGHDQIVVMVHCGSRGFGHQVASDFLRVFEKAMRRYGISVKDQQLACAPFRSPEGQDYFAAMNCAANSAFANRQVITHQVREA